MQFNRNMRKEFGFEHKNFEIFQEPTFFQKLPSNSKINTNLIEPCITKEFAHIIREIGLKAIEQLKKKKKDFVHTYTDGSSDKIIINRGSGLFLTTPNVTIHQCMFGARNTASNITCELHAIMQALDMYKAHPALEQANGLVIFCDSAAALQAISKGNSFITNKDIFLFAGYWKTEQNLSPSMAACTCKYWRK